MLQIVQPNCRKEVRQAHDTPHSNPYGNNLSTNTCHVAQAQQEILNLARRLEAEGKVILKLETGDEMLA